MPLSRRQREFVEHMVCCEDTGVTDADFAVMIGVSPETVKGWRRRPDVTAAFEVALAAYEDVSSPLGRKTFVWAVEEAIVNYRASEGAEKRHWWKVIHDMTEPTASASAKVDYSEWTMTDLEDEFSKRGMDETEAAIAAAKGAI